MAYTGLAWAVNGIQAVAVFQGYLLTCSKLVPKQVALQAFISVSLQVWCTRRVFCRLPAKPV